VSRLAASAAAVALLAGTGGQGAGRSLRTPPLPGTLPGSLVTAAAINGKGVVALGTSVGSVDVVTGGKALRLTVAHGRTTALALSRDGTTVAGLVGLDTGVSLWVWRRGGGLRQGLLPEAAETVALSAAGDLVAASGFDATVYDVGTGAHATFRQPAARGGSDQYSALALASASRLVAASIRRVDVWDLTSERLLHAFRCDCGADGVSLSHDGRLAVFGTNDAHVLVWNVTTERLLLDRTLSTVRGDHAYGSAARTDGAIVAAGTASGPSCSSTVAPERR
jgi:WD40 repeat protein